MDLELLRAHRAVAPEQALQPADRLVHLEHSRTLSRVRLFTSIMTPSPLITMTPLGAASNRTSNSSRVGLRSIPKRPGRPREMSTPAIGKRDGDDQQHTSSGGKGPLRARGRRLQDAIRDADREIPSGDLGLAVEPMKWNALPVHRSADMLWYQAARLSLTCVPANSLCSLGARDDDATSGQSPLRVDRDGNPSVFNIAANRSNGTPAATRITQIGRREAPAQ